MKTPTAKQQYQALTHNSELSFISAVLNNPEAKSQQEQLEWGCSDIETLYWIAIELHRVSGGWLAEDIENYQD